MDLESLRSLDAGSGREVGHRLVGRDVLGPAVRVAAVVERVDADEDVLGAERLGPGERKGQEYRVARRHVGDRNAVAHLGDGAALRDVDVTGQCRAAELAQVDVDDDVVLHAGGSRNSCGGFEFDLVALAVAEGHRVDVEAFGLGDCECGGGVEAAAQQADGFL